MEEDERDRWIVMERAKKIGKVRFRQLMDGVDIVDFHHHIINTMGPQAFRVEPDVEAKLDENEFAQDLIEMIMNFDLEPGDFRRPSSFGEIDGRLVLTDYGLNKEVYRKHYKRKPTTSGLGW